MSRSTSARAFRKVKTGWRTLGYGNGGKKAVIGIVGLAESLCGSLPEEKEAWTADAGLGHSRFGSG